MTRQAVRLGGDLPEHVDAGEVASLGTTDVQRIGRILDVSARGTGAVFSYITVAVILLLSSPELGLVLLASAPIAALAVSAGHAPARTAPDGRTRASVGGLVDRGGHGGRAPGAAGPRRRGGVRWPVLRGVATGQAGDGAYGSDPVDPRLVPGPFPGAILVAVTYLGAHLVVEGKIPPGHLVAYYAYAAFLLLPDPDVDGGGDALVGGDGGGGRVISVLRMDPDLVSPTADPPASSPRPGPIADSSTGLVVEPGR